jgi:Spy/CpxP family protein refolding chaperone
LNLTPKQIMQLEKIRLQAIKNAELIHKITENLALLEAKLEQAEPDLRKVVENGRARFDATRLLVQANMDSRLALYEGMTPEQKQIVAGVIEKNLERIAQLQQLVMHLLEIIRDILTISRPLIAAAAPEPRCYGGVCVLQV